jgi:hypothetical protein
VAGEGSAGAKEKVVTDGGAVLAGEGAGTATAGDGVEDMAGGNDAGAGVAGDGAEGNGAGAVVADDGAEGAAARDAGSVDASRST